MVSEDIKCYPNLIKKGYVPVCPLCNETVDIYKSFHIFRGQYCHVPCFGNKVGYPRWYTRTPRKGPQQERYKKKFNPLKVKIPLMQTWVPIDTKESR
jgi:hypothetical protein